ncbi:hypothetical protein [Asanoa siamensis]|uniref:Uncharacterized protein n=1 Tax=Asanoa siamensis TaxID=926357 RepID=A0ABQ4CRF0_9ACTN|nr:hypothetical protein [Asanoa siamensis]GIF73568.1 hypothetical protein Asi02nite_30860 [Asanoa siamensis]
MPKLHPTRLAGATVLISAMLASVAAPAAQAAPAAAPRLELRAVAVSQSPMAPPEGEIGKHERVLVIEVDNKLHILGSVGVYVYPNRKKVIIVCDSNGDNLEPGVQVDPSAGEPLLYQDPNGSHAGCLNHEIYYPVRKFRFAAHHANSASAVAWWEWFGAPPLPHPDY